MPVEPVEDIVTKDFVEHMSTGFAKLFPGYKFNRELNEATLEALKSMQTVESVAAKRGKRVEDILG